MRALDGVEVRRRKGCGENPKGVASDEFVECWEVDICVDWTEIHGGVLVV